MVYLKDPVFLSLLVALPLILWTARDKRSFPGLSEKRIFAVKTLRSITIILLILAIAGISLKTPLKDKSVIFLVDRSDSISSGEKDRALNFVRDAIKASGNDDRSGLVYFGKGSQIEFIPSKKKQEPTLSSIVDTSNTNIAGAVQAAIPMLAQDTLRKIVLLTDGNENDGDIQEATELADSNGVQIDLVEMQSLNKNEVILLSLDLPNRVRINETFKVAASVESDYDTTANVILTKQGRIVSSRKAELKSGTNKIEFFIKENDPGYSTYEAIVEAPKDNFSENNLAHGTTFLEGSARVLLVADQPSSKNIKQALSASTIGVDSILPEQLKFAKLEIYSSVILLNVPYGDIGLETSGKIEHYVKNIGGGLIVVGGEDSLGPGGYLETPLEKVLPVKMDVPNKKRSPSVAQVLVIDKSGSMGACHCGGGGAGGMGNEGREERGINKVELAKTAALKASHMLTKKDFFGVVATDNKASWPHKISPGGTLDPKVGTLKADGPSNIFQGVELGFEGLMSVNAKTKHMILLTDGWTDLKKLQNLISELRDKRVTLSIVAAGEGSSGELRSIANEAKGRFYPMENENAIPEIVAKETKTALRPFIYEKPFYPVGVGSNAILNSLGQRTRLLTGHILTTIKPTSEQILVSDEGDPLLALWQYGLGRSAAWTSDSGERWAKNWVQSNDFAKFITAINQQVFPQKSKRQFEASFERLGREYAVTIKTSEKDSDLDAAAEINFPSMKQEQASLFMESPGVFKGRFEANEKGPYTAKISLFSKNKVKAVETFNFVSSFSSEYLHRTPNKKLLSRVAEETGGNIINDPTAVFGEEFRQSYLSQEIWRILLIIALLLFFADVALRKLVITKQDTIEMRDDFKKWMRKRFSSESNEVERSAVVERLSNAKKRALNNQS